MLEEVKAMSLNRKQQQGFSLLEALVAMVLTSIIALGGALSMGKIMQVQRQSNLQQIAVGELRNLLQTSGQQLCGTSPSISVNGESLDVSVECNSSVTVGTTDISVEHPVLTTQSNEKTQDFFGGDGVIKVGNAL